MNNEEKQEKGNPLRDHLRRTFQDLQPTESAPDELKKDVFDTLDSIQLMADLADLFTVKFAQTEAKVFGLNNSSNPTDPEKPNEPPTPEGK